MPKITKMSTGGALSASPLNAALEALLASEAEYAGKLAAVREVIAGLRTVLGVESPSAPVGAPTPRAKTPHTNVPDRIESGNSKGDRTKARILAALKRGPLTTIDLAAKVGMSKSAAGYHVRQLREDRAIVFVGEGRATKIALAGSAPKEAP